MHSNDLHQTDGAIVAATLRGEREQFELLVRRYQPALWRVAFSRLGERQASEDAVQETFLCAYKSLHTYDSRFSFRTWLWTILLNQCRRSLQKRARTPKSSTGDSRRGGDAPSFDELASGEALPHTRLLAKERAERLEQLLSTLPDPQADALRLRFFGGLKFQEIADAMRCSLATAKNRVRWGLQRMSDLLVSPFPPAEGVTPGNGHGEPK